MKNKYYCKNCGKEISRFSGVYGKGRCGSCASKLSKLGIKRPEHSEWMKKNNPFKDKHHTKETRKKISKSRQGISYLKGISLSLAHRKNISFNHADMKGLNNPNWQGGISKEGYPCKFNDFLKEKIRKRDNYTCQNCDMTDEEHLIVCGKVLSVHHIDYNKKNCDKSNLITVCNQCNVRANFNRDYWKNYFQDKINVVN